MSSSTLEDGSLRDKNSAASNIVEVELSSTNDNIPSPPNIEPSHKDPQISSSISLPLTAWNLATYNKMPVDLTKRTKEVAKLRQAAQDLGIDTSLTGFRNIIEETEGTYLLPRERFIASR